MPEFPGAMSNYEPTPRRPIAQLLEPTLNPASHSSTRTTHLISDVLTIAALWAMEMRRRKSRAV